MLFVGKYVDDIIPASNSASVCPNGVESLRDHFLRIIAERLKFKMNGRLSWYCSVEIEDALEEERRVIRLTQHNYIEKLRDRFGLDENTRTYATPMEPGVSYSLADSPSTEEEKAEMQKFPYRALIGSLMYLYVCTRPEIGYAIHVFSRFLLNPGKRHWSGALRVLAYLCGTPRRGVTFRQPREQSSVPLLFFQTDSSWADNKDTGKTTLALLGFLNGPFTWRTKSSSTHALSSQGGEIMAASEGIREALWARQMCKDLGCPQHLPTLVQVDNQGAVRHSFNPVEHSRTKHMLELVFFMRERVNRGEVVLQWIRTTENMSDLLTKAVKGLTFAYLCNLLFGDELA